MDPPRAYFKQSLQLHREQKISDLTFLNKNIFHLLKFLTTFFSHSLRICHLICHFALVFFSHSLESQLLRIQIFDDVFCHSPEFSPFQITFFSHSLEICRFHRCFRSSHLQSYNYMCNCTIHLLQLQISFYNCRNSDQLHVKICPGSAENRSRPMCTKLTKEEFTTEPRNL